MKHFKKDRFREEPVSPREGDQRQASGKPRSALERFRLLQPFLEEGVPLPRLAEQHGISLRTARRWARRYREEGLTGLRRKARSDRGERRPVAAQWKDVVEALALRKPRVPVAAIHRRVIQLAEEKGLAAPSYSTVYDIARKIDPALLTLAHEGAKAYDQTYELLYRREASGPNEVWQADHTCLPILVYDEKGAAAKPWLTVIEDDYSRAISGYFLSFDAPTAMRTALALRQAIWRKTEAKWPVCGIPGTLYTDHGSDFTSRHIEQVCIDLKVRLIFSTAGKPRGRGRIERFFQTVEQLFLTRQPGYAPDGHLRTAQAAMDLTALDKRFRDFLVEDYHHRPHSATGQPPVQHWSAGGFLPRLPESLEVLDELLLTVARPRKVHRDGIRFQSLRYIDPVLAAYVGEDVTIRYDPRDLAEVRVYHDGAFLCRAVCQELAGETVSLRDITAARRQRKRELKETLTKRRSLLDVILETPALPSFPHSLAETTKLEEKEKPRHTLKRYRHE